ncbi:hypothetical protein F5Y11DRAFT_145915 [Daldinia sp. FL1419]|nr:hypothetical protein F5Y11DRAFT_145915 [Daldinia sp. FL1419]
MLRVLGGLGTHDLSTIREIIGMPRGVSGAMLTFPGIFSVVEGITPKTITVDIQVAKYTAHELSVGILCIYLFGEDC